MNSYKYMISRSSINHKLVNIVADSAGDRDKFYLQIHIYNNKASIVNPFDSEVEGTEPSTSSSKKRAKSSKLKSIVKDKPKKPAAPAKDLFGSDSDSERESSKRSKKFKRSCVLESSDEEGELEPVRATALKSSLSRRTASGYTFQQDLTRNGDYYIELKVYNRRDAEKLGNDRWKQALLNYKASLYANSTTWKAVARLVAAAKAEFKGIQPILYPHNTV